MRDSEASDTVKRALIIFNPTAGRRRRHTLDNFVQELDACGVIATVRETGGPGDAANFAKSANPTDCDVVIAAGGDGTVNEIVNGLVNFDIPLAVLPLGTANVLALELGLPKDLRKLAALVARGRTNTVFIPTANNNPFVLMAGIGFDAQVVDAMTPPLKRRFGKLAYVLLSLAGLSRFSQTKYAITIDGVRYDTASAIIANGHFYGGQFVCALEASLYNAALHVCLFTRTGAWNALRYATGLVTGRLQSFADIKIVSGKNIVVQTPLDDPVQGDGDILTRLPVEIKAGVRTLKFISAR